MHLEWNKTNMKRLHTVRALFSSATLDKDRTRKMPRKQKETVVSTVAKHEKTDDYCSVSPSSSLQSNSPMREETPMVAQKGKKRPTEAVAEDPDDFGQGIQKMLECFGTDYIKNSMQNKKKRLEQLTQNAFKASSKTVDEIFKVQNSERKRLQDEYSKQVTSVFQQWESDLEKTKEQENKLTILYKQQQKLFEQARTVQSQRLKTIKQLYSQYTMGMEELESSHQNQATNAQAELKKEMSLLQKKILMDTQQQEMANVRKNLQTMLF